MTPNEVLQALEAQNPDALLLEPRDMYDSALVGLTDNPKDDWQRPDDTTVAVYSAERCIDILVGEGLSEEDAREWFFYNTAGAWVGRHTPTFVFSGEQ
jgi:hypothetical protein